MSIITPKAPHAATSDDAARQSYAVLLLTKLHHAYGAYVYSPPDGLTARSGTVLVAVVHAADGVRLAVAAASRAELVRRLAEYVQAWADYTLWPRDARYVRALLARGELEAAVEVYFGLVGQRWDEEWLVTAAVPTDGRADTSTAVGAIAPPPGRLVEPSRTADAR